MEELLNKLIEKGWKPRGEKIYNGIEVENYSIIFQCYDNKDKYIGTDIKNIRTLVSKESGLWQFVCENGMVKKMKKINKGIWIDSWHKDAYESYPVYTMEKYEYWILESALKDESELEEFLLNNIKIDGE